MAYSSAQRVKRGSARIGLVLGIIIGLIVAAGWWTFFSPNDLQDRVRAHDENCVRLIDKPSNFELSNDERLRRNRAKQACFDQAPTVLSDRMLSTGIAMLIFAAIVGVTTALTSAMGWAVAGFMKD